MIINEKGYCHCATDKYLSKYRFILPFGYAPSETNLKVGAFLVVDAMYYCQIHKAYIITRHCVDEELYPSFSAKRLQDRSFLFLVSVRLNRFNGFFQVDSGDLINFVSDPKNLLHGLIDLSAEFGVEDEDTPRAQQFFLVFIRHVLQSVAKFEIVELHDDTKRLIKKHVPFNSYGILLDTNGLIFCPHVTNFDVRADEYHHVSSLVVGQWFRFTACFDETLQYYKVCSTVIGGQLYPSIEFVSTSRGDFAFCIQVENDLSDNSFKFVWNPQMGFIEDLDGRPFTFLSFWGKKIDFDRQKMKSILSSSQFKTYWENYKKLKKEVPYGNGLWIWCIYNTALNRQSVLRFFCFDKPQ